MWDETVDFIHPMAEAAKERPATGLEEYLAFMPSVGFDDGSAVIVDDPASAAFLQPNRFE